jgi:hypothetical protein
MSISSNSSPSRPLLSLPSTPTTTMDTEGTSEATAGHVRNTSLFKRSWNAVADVISPFSPSALATLPKVPVERIDREIRTDNIPEAGSSAYAGVRDYNSINANLPPNVTIPQKVPTIIRVESKVWFANERSEYPSLLIAFGSKSVYSVDSLHEHWRPTWYPCSSIIKRLERQCLSLLWLCLRTYQLRGNREYLSVVPYFGFDATTLTYTE